MYVLAILTAAAIGALPPPPTTAVRPTRMFGTITVDHVLHLRERAPCITCHGGPISKIAPMPARHAHATCRGCHVERGRGPTACRGCHRVGDGADPVAAPANDPRGGWRQLRWCMTTAEAHAALATMGATPNPPFETCEPWFAPASAAQCYVVAIDVRPAPDPAPKRAMLQFVRGALRAIRVEVDTAGDTGVVFARLGAMLGEQYGAPSEGGARKDWAVFVAGDTEVTLFSAVDDVWPIQLVYRSSPQVACGSESDQGDRSTAAPRPTIRPAAASREW